MSGRSIPRSALLLSFLLLLVSCTKEGDTITYENPTPSPPASGTIVAMSTTNVLVNVSPSAPSTVISALPIQGIPAGVTFLGIDYRPADKQLYGFGTDSRLYRINTLTGVALQVGGVAVAGLTGTYYGFDFNPVVDRARIVNEADENRRISAVDGSDITDPPLAFAVGDVNAGQDPFVTAIAYTNSVAGATTTTVYGIDQGGNQLVTINPANNGTLNTVGDIVIGVNIGAVGFDIAANGIAYASFDAGNGVSNLLTIALVTGAATLVGQLGTGTFVTGIAVVP